MQCLNCQPVPNSGAEVVPNGETFHVYAIIPRN